MVVAECSPSKALTARQEKILQVICGCIRDHGLPPSVREMGDAVDIRSPNGIMFHLKAMEKKGFLRLYEARGSRTLKVLKEPAGWLLVDGLLIRKNEARGIWVKLLKAMRKQDVARKEAVAAS